MGNKKASAVFADSKSIQTNEFRLIRDPEQSVSEVVLEKLKNPMQMVLDLAQSVDTQSGVSKAISDAVRHDAENSKFTTVKETKERRRFIIVDTIMKHGRNLDS